MKLQKLWIFLAVAIGFSSAALAAGPGSAAITWTNPTTAKDGTATTLTLNTLYRGSKPDGSDLVKLATITPPAKSYADTALDLGTHCYAVTASNASGESERSAVVCKTILQAVPGSIITITVQ